MSSSLNRIKKNIIEAMQSSNNQGTSAYDSVAEVRRVEGDTAWVHIAGGVDETPVKLTIAAKAGDTVQVRVGGGRAWITGNASAPPTDDHMANTANTTAKTANVTANQALQGANTAQNTADKAQSSADKAQNTATEAAKTADNYISTDSTGIMVSENKGATKETPSNATKNNVLITEKDVQIRNGQKVVSSYGETSTIGATAGNHVTIADDGVRMKSSAAQIAKFGIIKAGTRKSQTWTYIMSDEKWYSLPALKTGEIYEGVFQPNYFPGNVESLKFWTTSGDELEVPSDKNATAFFYVTKYGGIHIVGRDGRPSEEFAAFDWDNVYKLTADYTTKNDAPFLVVGTEPTESVLTINSDFERVLDVDNFGNVIVYNTIASEYGGVDCARGVVNCKSLTAEDDQRNRVSFTEITSGKARIRVTTGTVTMAPKWWRCGNLVQMEFRVAAVAAVAPGNNLATGTIEGIPRPVTTTGLRAVSYYGDNANVSFVSQDGAFTVRNCGSDTMAKGNDATGIFTYITDGTFTGGSGTGGQPGGGA